MKSSTAGTRLAALLLALLTACTLVVGVVGVTAASASTNVIIPSNTNIASGQEFKTDNKIRLAMQTDGNLVVYNDNTGLALWNSGTSGQPGNFAYMQTDGNFVVYSKAGQPRWQTVTNGQPNSSGAHAAIQGDGNFVIYSASGQPLWNSFYDAQRAQPAIAWMRAHLGSTSYEHLCETAVENAFGNTFRYNRAIDDYNARLAAGQIRKNLPAPRGALVFYNTSADGHVAISLGDGTNVISTSVGNRIGIAAASGYFANYLGWAYAP
jgi:hypothetical protein